MLDFAGRDDATPLLFLHGGGLNRKMWSPQMDLLSDVFRVLSPDLPGHGVLGETPFTETNAIDTVAGVIEDEVKGPTVVVGLSLGGYVAIAHAALHPEQVTGLVLSGCCINYRGWLKAAAVANVYALGLYGAKRFEAAQGRRLRAAYPEAIADAILSGRVVKDGARAGLLWAARTDFHSKLAKYSGPVLILNGETDRLNRRAEAEALGAAQNARLETIKDAGHLCSLDRPEAFSEAVRTFAMNLA